MSENDIDRENEEEEEDSFVAEDYQEIEPPEEYKIDVLHKKIKNGLQVIGKTVEGEGWAFTQLECEGQNISDLYEVLLGYPYLRQINFYRNKIDDYSTLCQIKFLTHLNLKENNISSFEHFNLKGKLEFLEYLNLANNSFNSLDCFELKNLKQLILDKNEISSAEKFAGHPTLENLSLNQNKMKSLEHLKNMPALTTLSLTDNPVAKLSGLENTNQIKNLILINTQIEEFKEGEDLPDLPYLNTLNLEKCTKFNHMKSFDALLKYKDSLNTVNVNSTLLAEEVGDAVKQEILMKLPGLKSINEEPVEQEEVEQALQTLKEREEEAKRIAEEEAEAKRLAEEEAKNKENEEGEGEED